MNNSKLVNLLRAFSKHEIKEFEKIVASPYFNRGRNYLPFLKELKKFYPEFDHEKMTDEHIFAKMYPHKKFNKQIIWNMNSALLNMAEQFLLLNSLKRNKFIKDHQIAGELQVRKLAKHFQKKIGEMEDELNSTKINRDYFLFRKQLESARKEYYYLEEKHRLIPALSVKQGEYAILFFLWNIVEVVNDMNVYSYMFNAAFELNIINEFIKNLQLKNIVHYCKLKKFIYSWLMEMYYNQIMMTIEPEKSEYFFNLKKLFEKNYEKFTDEEKFNWVTCLINYCGYKNDNHFRKILFEIHKFELKEGMAFTGKYLSKTHYLQILKNALAINQTEWIKNFIEEFAAKLKPSYQKSMRALSFAYYYLKLKNYEKVLEYLSRDKFVDPKDKFAVKLVYIKAYYDLNEVETLFYHIDSTLRFISNNQKLIRDDIAANYNKCLKLLKKLIIAKENNNVMTLDEIRIMVDKDKSLILGDWLLEKIKEIGIKRR
jgi:hypothetical protein